MRIGIPKNKRRMVRNCHCVGDAIKATFWGVVFLLSLEYYMLYIHQYVSQVNFH
jgi:hypothetical protein